MFFTAIAIAIILRNNTPLGPVCLLLQHTAVAPVASAPWSWPQSSERWPCFLSQSCSHHPNPGLRGPGCLECPSVTCCKSVIHLLGPGTLWLPAKLTAFKMIGKNHTGLQVRLELTNEGVLVAWPTPTCPVFPALLTGEAWHSELLQTLFGRRSAYLGRWQNEAARTDVCTEHLRMPLSTPEHPSHSKDGQDRAGLGTLNPPDTFCENAGSSFLAFQGTLRKKMAKGWSRRQGFICRYWMQA